MKYHFRQPKAEGEQLWYDYLSKIGLFYPPPPSVYSIACAHYIYNLRRKSVPKEYATILQSKMVDMCDMLIPSVRESFMGFDPLVDGAICDQRSRAQHTGTDPYIDPEENSVTDPFLDENKLEDVDREEECETISDNRSEIAEDNISITSDIDTWENASTISINIWAENGTVLNLIDSLLDRPNKEE
jgi:hypothetical protein